jgi:uncharacterized protein YceK
MKPILLAIIIPLLLGGCLSFSDTTPAKTTVVVAPSGATTVLAPGTTVVCTNGRSPPC